MSQLREKTHRLIGRAFQRHADRVQASLKEHTAIPDAVISGDRDLAVAKIKEHLEYGKQLLLTPSR